MVDVASVQVILYREGPGEGILNHSEVLTKALPASYAVILRSGVLLLSSPDFSDLCPVAITLQIFLQIDSQAPHKSSQWQLCETGSLVPEVI